MLQVAKAENSDADLTEDASKTNKEDYDMNISDKEEQRTVKYQVTLKIDVKSINNMKLLMLHFLKKQNFSHKISWTYVKI